MTDLILRGGRVIDPSQQIDEVADVAFKGGAVEKVGRNLSGTPETEIHDVAGKVVTPGLVDLHTHVYWGGTSLGVDADRYMATSAVTTAIDTGSAGPGNFAGFRKHVIEPAKARVLAYLHVSFSGIYGFGQEVSVGESTDIRMMAPRSAAEVADANRDVIVGIKIRLGRNASGDQGLNPLTFALQVGEEVGMPVMAHIDEPPPSYEALVAALRPGDVLTHCFRPFPNSPVGENGKVRDAVAEGRRRGVLFDVGHGRGSFSFATARSMLDRGFPPDTISSDVHKLCENGPAFDQVTTMSKFLALGMDLPEVVRLSTITPAAALQRPELGTLKSGAPGDASVLSIEDGAHDFSDVTGAHLAGDKRIFARGVVKAGEWVAPAPPPYA